MDGDLDDTEVDAAFAAELQAARCASRPGCATTSSATRCAAARADAPGFAGRFAARLAAEPTVIAPKPRAAGPIARRLGRGRDASRRSASSAGSPYSDARHRSPRRIAKAREAATVRAAQSGHGRSARLPARAPASIRRRLRSRASVPCLRTASAGGPCIGRSRTRARGAVSPDRHRGDGGLRAGRGDGAARRAAGVGGARARRAFAAPRCAAGCERTR